MKEIRSKKGSKQIICIIVMIMLCNFIVPNYSYAVSTEGGGSALEVISQFICFIPDTVINYLQDMFTSPEGIYNEISEEYIILYSPGTIFSGQIPAFDINFIGKSKEPKKVINDNYYTLCGTGTMWELSNDDFKNNYSNNYQNVKEMMRALATEGIIRNNNSNDGLVLNGEFQNVGDMLQIGYVKEDILLTDIFSKFGITMEEDFLFSINSGMYSGEPQGDKSNIEGYTVASDPGTSGINVYLENISINGIKYESTNLLYDTYQVVATSTDSKSQYEIIGHYGNINDKHYTYMKVRTVVDDHEGLASEKSYQYISSILQPIVATWYNALRRIALVGLLSVLVYLGIMILLTSTSAKDKAKYKNMLKDWLVALCILFALHYIMSVTIIAVEKINEVIKASSIGANGEDILMSTVRQYISDGESWGSVLAYVAIYCVLTVYTVIFTIQYLKRVVYLAFLTMIAPLITLTYPLDKIKDKKSQAFDMWIRDYIFFTLIQVLHLLIYYIFLGSALDLAKQGNWLFAIVAIGFMTKAEKLMKKMFGFEKSKSLGAMAAGATGAFVMNGINKLKGFGGKKGKSGGDDGSSGGSSNSNVRTVTTDPLAALRVGGTMPASDFGGGNSSTSQESASLSGTSNSNGHLLGVGTEGTNIVQNINTSFSPSGDTTINNRTNTISTNNISTSNSNKPKRNIWNGVTAVGGKYFPTVAKGVLGAGVGLTGAMIGFAAGVAQGDAGKAFGGAVVGGTAGMNLGKAAVDLPKNVIDGVEKGWNNARDTWNRGVYGEEYANNVKFDRNFRNSSVYSELKRDSGFEDNVFDEKVSQMLDSGITDAKIMQKILKNNKKYPRKYNMDKAITYSTMAQKCSEDILYDRNKFIRYCQDHDIEIPEEELENLRKCIIDFK